MTQPSEQGKRAIEQLVELGHMRVWSVIITIFGDAVAPRGGVVASATLGVLTEQMGVKPEALRVALSRLAKDGWIERSKQGRLSFYNLSKSGVSEFGPASARIYAPGPGKEDTWYMGILPNAPGDDLPKGAVSLGGRVVLGKGKDLGRAGLCVSGRFSAVPDWARSRIGPEDVAQGYEHLFRVLSSISCKDLTDLQAAVMRVLVVHQWRRLVLRHADLPPRFFPQGWKGEECRSLVAGLLEALGPASARWFDKQIS